MKSFSFILIILMWACPAWSAASSADSLWNISDAGFITVWTEQTEPLGRSVSTFLSAQPYSDTLHYRALGMTWLEERDVVSLRVVYASPLSERQAGAMALQYWFNSWPEPPPHMPSVEDQWDDHWQGQWLTARTSSWQKHDTLMFSFAPLQAAENPNAPHLPQVNYRRTLKIRLLSPAQSPKVKSLQIFSPASGRRLSVRLQFSDSTVSQEMEQGSLCVHNGRLLGLKQWQWQHGDRFLSKSSWRIKPTIKGKGIIAEILAAHPLLAGSNDQTVITISRGRGTFSFSCRDLLAGPVYVPAFGTLATVATDAPVEIKHLIKGTTVRQKLRLQPEQTYERSSREIPALNPVERDRNGIGDRLYLPLAADASWQKFGLEWGGNVFMNKKYCRLKGRELTRCAWPGDVFRWEFGTGLEPNYVRSLQQCRMSVLHDYLPIVTASWTQDGLNYDEEAFVSLPQSSLSPRAGDRNEQAPALLYIRFSVANPSNQDRTAHIWCKGAPVDRLEYEHGFMYQTVAADRQVRGYVHAPEAFLAETVAVPENGKEAAALHITLALPANESRSLYVELPFVSDLTARDAPLFQKTDYTSEKDRVAEYWRAQVNEGAAINVPEAKFSQMARAVIPHIQIGVIKDPGSGLYMVPAAALRYYVYANESCFQMLLLDRLGYHDLVSDYLETFIRLQGSKPLPGDFSGDQKAVYYGACVDRVYDYTATGYNLHHGTVLWMMGQHYLLSNDREWLGHAAASMRQAADWIIAQRKQTKNDDFYRHLAPGLLPSGRLEDNREWGQWFSVNAYAWLGLDATARALQRAGMDGSAYYRQQADDYLQDLRTAITVASERAPVVRLRDRTFAPFLPTRAGQRYRGFDRKLDYFNRYDPTIKPMLRLSATRELLYGPMILLNTGVIQPNEPLADWILDDWEDNLTLSSSLGLPVHGWVEDEKWFSQGGMVFQANLQNPIQAYLQRREIPAAVRHLYNAMVSCLHPDVNVFTEEYRMWVSGSGPFYKAPDEARFVQRVLDLLVLETAGELWLAAGTPRRWLEPGQRVAVQELATVYGQVGFELYHGAVPRTIEANIRLAIRQHPKSVKLFVRAPFQTPIKSVWLDGEPWRQWDAEQEMIILPGDKSAMRLRIDY